MSAASSSRDPVLHDPGRSNSRASDSWRSSVASRLPGYLCRLFLLALLGALVAQLLAPIFFWVGWQQGLRQHAVWLLLTVALASLLLLCCLGTEGSLAWLRQDFPEPYASRNGGVKLGTARFRLPSPEGAEGQSGLYAQIVYPSTAGHGLLDGVEVGPYMRKESIDHLGGAAFATRLKQAVLGRQPQVDPPSVPRRSADAAGWPIILYSGGLMHSAEMYSQFCRELAAIGAIVVAVEHEDGSASYATTAVGRVVDYKKPGRDLTLAEIMAFRSPCLEKRLCEYDCTLRALVEISRGTLAAEPALQEILRIGDPERLFLAGHSFGAAGVWNFLLNRSHAGTLLPSIKGALFYDIWVQPLPGQDADGNENWKLPPDLPAIQVRSKTWAFAQWEGMQERFSKIFKENEFLASVWVDGTQHQWISDCPLWVPSFLARKLNFLADADWHRTFEATMAVTKAAVDCMLDPARRPEIQRSIDAYANVLVKDP